MKLYPLKGYYDYLEKNQLKFQFYINVEKDLNIFKFDDIYEKLKTIYKKNKRCKFLINTNQLCYNCFFDIKSDFYSNIKFDIYYKNNLNNSFNICFYYEIDIDDKKIEFVKNFSGFLLGDFNLYNIQDNYKIYTYYKYIEKDFTKNIHNHINEYILTIL